MPQLRFSILTILLLLIPLSSASAEQRAEIAEAKPKAYAILVGNNAGGPGQSDLRFAEEDAKRMRSVLRELGGYDFQESSLLLSPSPMALWDQFESIQAQLEQDRAAGIQSMLFFYYSGHARSAAIDLGPQQVALADLRKRIETMPAELRIVILDACQSGAISRVKGASPAVDFSTNSVAGLHMSGMAIMASSTGTELSQESDSLQGSVFTHHLVTGLRGLADKNADGLISLSEAYDYAYASTLMATAVSAVGKQHVTLETDLHGKGDVHLTRPLAADAKLLLPSNLSGAITIAHRKSKSVRAELNKVKGHAAMIAFPAAGYTLLYRQGKHAARECSLTLRSGETTRLRLADCKVVAIAEARDKGGPGSAPVLVGLTEPPDTRPLWNIEVSIGLRSRSEDSYNQTLETFGFERESDLFEVNGHYAFRALRRVGPHLSLGASLGSVEAASYNRHTDGASTYHLDWSTSHLSALARIDHRAGISQVFAETELGLSRSVSTLSETAMSRATSESHYGYSASGAIGVALMPWQRFGFTARLGYGISSTLSNELGETHLARGVISSFGVRAAL